MPSVSLIGGGAVATALARDLSAAGWSVRAWTRDRERAPAPYLELPDFAGAELVVVCVRDDAIGAVADELRRAAGQQAAPSPVVHTSGFHDSAVLQPLADAGWRTGSLHPLRSVPLARAAESGPTFAGSWFTIEGDGLARSACERLVAAVEGRALVLAGSDRARYHAAATLAAGGVVALLDAALEVLGAAGPGATGDARRAFAELSRGALDNAARVGAADALTGPLVRGDVEVVAGHLESIGEVDGGVLEVYRLLARRSLRLLRERGGSALPDGVIARLERLLGHADE